VSRAGICDGTRDCPDGEDELNCNATRGPRGESIRPPLVFCLMYSVFKLCSNSLLGLILTFSILPHLGFV